MRLDEEWKTQKREQGSEIGKSEEGIGRAAGGAACVPRLQQRACGAEKNEREADGKGEQA